MCKFSESWNKLLHVLEQDDSVVPWRNFAAGPGLFPVFRVARKACVQLFAYAGFPSSPTSSAASGSS